MTADAIGDMAMMGLIGELGELSEIFKKKIFHGKSLLSYQVVEEAGDFLWYITLAATHAGAKLSSWAGMSAFTDIEECAARALIETAARFPEKTEAEICELPTNFFVLAKVVTGGTPVIEALIMLAVILAPYGGLNAAAIANVEKLESRYDLPNWAASPMPSDVEVEVTTTPVPEAGATSETEVIAAEVSVQPVAVTDTQEGVTE